jgi:hypothetical protein
MSNKYYKTRYLGARSYLWNGRFRWFWPLKGLNRYHGQQFRCAWALKFLEFLRPLTSDFQRPMALIWVLMIMSLFRSLSHAPCSLLYKTIAKCPQSWTQLIRQSRRHGPVHRPDPHPGILQL